LPVGSFGERLQREREMRGITLEEISTATKIGTRSLRALEQEDFDKLPGGIFNKGFVRAYAKFLGINEEQAVADYLAAVDDTPASQFSLEELATNRQERQERDREALKAATGEGNGGGNFSWALISLLILLAVLIVASWQFYSKRRAARRVLSGQPAAVQKQTPAPVSATPPSSPQVGSPAPPTATALNSAATPAVGELVLVVRPKGVSWVTVRADGKTVLDRALTPADPELTFHATEQIAFYAGNAEVVSVLLNSKPQQVVSGQERKFTAKDVQ
jgi:cytoskeleton protein RodZ